MFRQMLFTQWKWSAWVLLPATIAGFAVPILAVQTAGQPLDRQAEVEWLLMSVQRWGILYPVLAVVVGLVLAMAAWAHDHRTGHVYALTLPIPRWLFALNRYAAGAVLLVPVVLGVWLGGLAAAATAFVPEGLHAYPGGLALRFALAALLAYAAFFAISSGTSRTAGYVLGGLGAVIVAELLLAVAGVEFSLLGPILPHLGDWPGPFEIFTGRWMLINV